MSDNPLLHVQIVRPSRASPQRQPASPAKWSMRLCLALMVWVVASGMANPGFPAGATEAELFRPSGVRSEAAHIMGWDDSSSSRIECVPPDRGNRIIDRCVNPDPGKGDPLSWLRQLALAKEWESVCTAAAICDDMASAIDCRRDPRAAASGVCSGLFVERIAARSDLIILRLSSSYYCSPTGEGCSSPWILFKSGARPIPLIAGRGEAVIADANGVITVNPGSLGGRSARVTTWTWQGLRLIQTCSASAPPLRSEADWLEAAVSARRDCGQMGQG